MNMKPCHQSGFTLIEVIIAIAIFAVVATLSYTGLQSVINSKTRTEASLDRLKQLQLSILTISTDMQQLADRNGKDALGSVLRKLTTHDADTIVSFTRGGWRNPAHRTRSTLQRVAYYIDEDTLIRRYWYHVDRADDEKFVDRELINNIDELSLRFLTEKDEWLEDWPSNEVLAGASPTSSPMPKAIEINLKMSDWGQVTRLVKVAL